jgi:pilus assembly protein Flp/PilA
MHSFLNNLGALAKDGSGPTALEYGLTADHVSVVIVTPVTTRGTTLTGTFATIAATLP